MLGLKAHLLRDYDPSRREAVGFTTDSAPGAIANGTRVVKIRQDDGDATAAGVQGEVIGSLFAEGLGYAYFVLWDTGPQVPVMIRDHRIAPVEPQPNMRRRP